GVQGPLRQPVQGGLARLHRRDHPPARHARGLDPIAAHAAQQAAVEPAAEARQHPAVKLRRRRGGGAGEGVSGKKTVRRGGGYERTLSEISALVAEARRTSARAVNAIMTATYWAIGRRIVEEEQGGTARASYGEELIRRLAADLTSRFGRGFGWRNLA